MLATIAIILVVLWLLGVVAIHVSSPLLHLLLVVAIIIFIFNFVAGRSSV